MKRFSLGLIFLILSPILVPFVVIMFFGSLIEEALDESL